VLAGFGVLALGALWYAVKSVFTPSHAGGQSPRT
jgi:hypothetical protein